MTRSILVLAASLTLALSSSRQDAVRAQQRSLDAANSGLELTVSVSNERSCFGDADVYSEVLGLTTRYTNRGNAPVTVFLGTDFAPRVLVAQSEEDLRVSKFESEQNADYYPMDGGRYMLGSNPKDERAVILAPGGSTMGKSGTSVIVKRSPSASMRGSISSGTHYLQIEMLIKVAEGHATDKLREHQHFRWVPVLSQPIRFDAPVNPILQDCSAKP